PPSHPPVGSSVPADTPPTTRKPTCGAAGASVEKGDTLIDTAENLMAMAPDMIVIRHKHPGAPKMLAERLPASIINAGDGAHEHPTQALLDAFTIRERLGRLTGVNVSILGDIAHYRVVRSNIHLLIKMVTK